MKKRIIAAAMLASVMGLGLFATSSFASGPIVLPVPAAPAVTVAPTVHTVPLKTKMLNTYRQVRAFWLSRSIVR